MMATPERGTSDVRLELDVWRELCRHLDLEAATQNLGTILGRALPLHRLAIRRLDAEHHRLETIGLFGPAAPVRTELEPVDFERVATWCDQGRVGWWSRGPGDRLGRALAWNGLDAAFLAGPLLDGARPLGVVVVEGEELRAEDGRLLQRLLEPLAYAVHNHARLNEMDRLREAAEAENRALLSKLQRVDITESVVGAEAGMRHVMERVEQVARTDAPVLLLGETGSGKEVIARQIHVRSSRARAPFLRVNCGAIPPELVDSELFGHERGSFTGAVATRKGWFERSDGGTLFLDELGELPAAAQVRLLRVLQDGTFERVGGQTPMTVDVRIVAATNSDLRNAVAEGKFRQDLWYRLNVFPIILPPLRERREDIPLLAAHFAAGAGRRLYGVPLVPTPSDVAAFVAYDWPGNVRELAAVIERAAILGGGHSLDTATALGVLPTRVYAEIPRTSAVSSADAEERERIDAVLRRCFGRIEGQFGAAKALGVNPHTLRSRMRRLGIDWSQYRQAGG
jgi:hydrogenase-4 transcriptional activator